MTIARRPIAVTLGTAAVAMALVMACSSDSTYEGGGRRLAPPGTSVDSGASPEADSNAAPDAGATPGTDGGGNEDGG
jgi:hypothetical protein